MTDCDKHYGWEPLDEECTHCPYEKGEDLEAALALLHNLVRGGSYLPPPTHWEDCKLRYCRNYHRRGVYSTPCCSCTCWVRQAEALLDKYPLSE